MGQPKVKLESFNQWANPRERNSHSRGNNETEREKKEINREREREGGSECVK